MILVAIITMISILTFNLNIIAKDIRHPANLYILSWTFSLCLLSIGVVNYVKVDNSTIFYIILTSIIFCIFSYFGSANFTRNDDIYNEIAGNGNLTRIVTVLGYIGLASALYYYQSRFGLANLISDPGFVRANDKGGSGLLGLLIFLPPTSFIVLSLLFFLKSKLNFIQYILIFLILIYMLVLPERSTLVNSLVWVLMGAYSLNRKRQIVSFGLLKNYGSKILIFTLLILAFFIFVSARTQKIQYVSNIDYAISSGNIVPKELIDPYIYLTGSIPAFNVILQNDSLRDLSVKFSPSKTTLVLGRLTQIIGSQGGENLTANADFIQIPFPFNTYTWLREPIADYGYIGALFYICLCAFVAGVSWKLAKRRQSILYAFLYGWAASASIFTILTNKFSSIYYTYAIGEIIVIYMLLKLLEKTSKKSNFSERRYF